MKGRNASTLIVDEVIQVRTCDGVVEGQRCKGRCKRELPMRCFQFYVTRGYRSPTCIQCQTGKYKASIQHNPFFGDEWDF